MKRQLTSFILLAKCSTIDSTPSSSRFSCLIVHCRLTTTALLWYGTVGVGGRVRSTSLFGSVALFAWSLAHGQHSQALIQGLAEPVLIPGTVPCVISRSPATTSLFVRKALQAMRVTRGTVQMFKRWDNFPYNTLDVHGLSIRLYLCDAAAI